MKALAIVRTALVAVAVLCFGVMVGSPASAQSTATITLLHGIPGVPVDVVVDGTVVFPNFQGGETKDLSDYAGQTLKNLEVRKAGETTAVIGPVDFPVPASGNVTAVAHLDADGAPKLSAFENDITPTEDGNGRLVVVHTAAAPPVDLVVGTDRPIVGLANGSSKGLELKAGPISGAKLALTGEAPSIDVPDVTVKAGFDLIVYAVGSAAGGTLTFYTQSIDVGENDPVTTTTSSTTTTTVAPTSTTSTTTPVSSTTTLATTTTSSTTSTTPTTEAPTGDATVTLLHGIPGVPVDVVVDGTVAFSNFKPEETKDLSSLSGTTLTKLEVRLAGTTTTVIGPIDLDVPESGNWTVLAHLDAMGKPALNAFENDTNKTEAGNGRLIVVHAAAAPAVDLIVGSERPIVGLTNGNSKALLLPAGAITGAQIAPTGGNAIADVPTVTLEAGTDLIVYAVGSLTDDTFTFYTQTIEVGQNDVTTSTSTTTTTTTPTTTIKPTTTTIQIRPPVTGSGSSTWILGLVLLSSGVALTLLARRTTLGQQ